MTLVAPVINEVPPLSRAARTATHTHEVGNTVMHTALRRDFARAARMLAGKPDARHRRALAAHLQWMLQVLHHHHTVEDQAIWPAVLRRRPDLANLVDELEAEHGELDVASRALRDAALTWSYDGSDRRRAELVVALSRMLEVLEPHLQHEEDHAMPVVCAVLTAADWIPIQEKINAGTPTMREKARQAHWALDGLDARREKILLRQVPRPALWFLRARYFGQERQRTAALWT
jgi:iron-sulfur cluster repair protein YtfE (RIC family)